MPIPTTSNHCLRYWELLLAQRRRDEPEPGVELRRFVIDGVGQHGSNTGLLGNQHRAANHIL